MAEALGGSTDRGGVDDRHEILQVFEQDGEEQMFIAILQRHETSVAVEWIAEALDIGADALDLLFQRVGGVRQQTVQVKIITLLWRKCRTFVELRMTNEIAATQRHLEAYLSVFCLDSLQWSHRIPVISSFTFVNCRMSLKKPEILAVWGVPVILAPASPSPYFGCMRIPPSIRTVSPFM